MKGFTLLEILVSIAITAILLAAVYGSYASSLGAIQAARDQGDVDQTARAVLDRMTRDLECAFIDAGDGRGDARPGMIGEDGETDAGPSDRICFTGLTHLSLTPEDPGTDLCEIGYRLAEDPEGDGFILYRRDQPVPDADLTTGGLRQELARGVTGLDIMYRDGKGNTLDHWNTLEGAPDRGLPPLITVRLSIRDPGGREHLFVTSVHPVLAGPEKEG